MKILKPGKVEMRKFVCGCCGCEFVAAIADLGYVNEITAWDIAVQLTEQGVTFREW